MKTEKIRKKSKEAQQKSRFSKQLLDAGTSEIRWCRLNHPTGSYTVKTVSARKKSVWAKQSFLSCASYKCLPDLNIKLGSSCMAVQQRFIAILPYSFPIGLGLFNIILTFYRVNLFLEASSPKWWACEPWLADCQESND